MAYKVLAVRLIFLFVFFTKLQKEKLKSYTSKKSTSGFSSTSSVPVIPIIASEHKIDSHNRIN